jgi:energy-coupling factor transport system substrate-specific component
MSSRLLSLSIYGLTSGLGIIAFLYPFWLPALAQSATSNQAHANDAGLLLALLVGLCLAVLLLEVQSQAVNTKTIALLGVLVAINATLRFAENAMPGPGGFSPIFLLIVLTGYVYGGRFGFLMGALTLLVSALLTGGVGPWLPYQMFTAGWVGMSAPLCRGVVRGLRAMHPRLAHVNQQLEVVILALFGGGWGLAYGAIMNIWFWPFALGDPTLYWQPGVGPAATLQRYALFYVVTSLLWDGLRSVGNLLLIGLLGAPVLRSLRRFYDRFEFSYQPAAPTFAGTAPVSLGVPSEERP